MCVEEKPSLNKNKIAIDTFRSQYSPSMCHATKLENEIMMFGRCIRVIFMHAFAPAENGS